MSLRKCEDVSWWVSGTIARTKMVLRPERKILVGPKRDMRGYDNARETLPDQKRCFLYSVLTAFETTLVG